MTGILFEEVSINGLCLKNRFVRSATAESMAFDDGRPSEQLGDLYRTLAQGEVGLIVTSGALIEAWPNPPQSIGVRSPLSMHDHSYIQPWGEVIEAVHAAGSKIAMQIGHLGRQDIPALRGAAPLAPSAVPIESTGVTPQEMTQADIDDMVEKFAAAGRRVQEAGFDAVEYHGAHGNIITNFMSPFTNRRRDGYGGGVENRARFAVEIVKRTREMVGPDFPLMIKLSFSDFVDGGLSGEEAVQIAVILAQSGIDCIEVSGGILSETMNRIAVKGIKREDQEAYFLPFATALKERVGIPVILVGGLRSPGIMAKVVQGGAADLVAMSRPLIREPGLVKRWQQGDLAKATCISCNQCFEGWIFRPTRCYQDEPLRENESRKQ